MKGFLCLSTVQIWVWHGLQDNLILRWCPTNLCSIWGYYQLNYRSQHVTEQRSWAVFSFTFIRTVVDLSVGLQTDEIWVSRNILGGLSLFVTFFWGTDRSSNFHNLKKNRSQTAPEFVEKVNFSVQLLHYVKCLKVKPPAKLFSVSEYMDCSTLLLIEQHWWVLIGKTLFIYLMHENSPSERMKSSSVLLFRNHEDQDLQPEGIPHIGCYLS